MSFHFSPKIIRPQPGPQEQFSDGRIAPGEGREFILKHRWNKTNA